MIVNVLVLFRFPSIFRALMILSFIFSYQEILSSQKLYMELGMGVNVSAIPKDGSTKLDLTATNVKIPFPSLRFRFIYNRSGFTLGMMQLPELSIFEYGVVPYKVYQSKKMDIYPDLCFFRYIGYNVLNQGGKLGLTIDYKTGHNFQVGTTFNVCVGGLDRILEGYNYRFFGVCNIFLSYRFYKKLAV
ncbi:MAG TPA: hypothetical protein P5235_01415 [Saprospiraceae bacterium]|nr:hypothetical protein [Saprospiraceae bacterium]